MRRSRNFDKEPELTQEKWSWKESKHGRSQREFAVDFLTGIASAHIRQDNKDVSEKINIEPGRTFAGFGFSIALSNLRKRLLKGEQVELRRSVFRRFPNAWPASSNSDNFPRRSAANENGGTIA